MAGRATGRRRQERQATQTCTRSREDATTISTAFGEGMALWDVPFELVGEVASAGAVAEAGDVERSAASARHVGAGVRRECGCSDTDAVVETSRGVLRVEVKGWLGDGRQRAAKDLSKRS